jgi:hypothetical protein
MAMIKQLATSRKAAQRRKESADAAQASLQTLHPHHHQRHLDIAAATILNTQTALAQT